MWTLIEDTPAGFPWLAIAGKTLTGWVVIDVDATLVTAPLDKDVLAAAIGRVPARFRAQILVRVDGASHELTRHLLSLSSPRKTALFTCGWMITAAESTRQSRRAWIISGH